MKLLGDYVNLCLTLYRYGTISYVLLHALVDNPLTLGLAMERINTVTSKPVSVPLTHLCDNLTGVLREARFINRVANLQTYTEHQN